MKNSSTRKFDDKDKKIVTENLTICKQKIVSKVDSIL